MENRLDTEDSSLSNLPSLITIIENDTHLDQETVTKTVTKLTVVYDEGRGKNIHHSRTN